MVNEELIFRRGSGKNHRNVRSEPDWTIYNVTPVDWGPAIDGVPPGADGTQ